MKKLHGLSPHAHKIAACKKGEFTENAKNAEKAQGDPSVIA